MFTIENKSFYLETYRNKRRKKDKESFELSRWLFFVLWQGLNLWGDLNVSLEMLSSGLWGTEVSVNKRALCDVYHGRGYTSRRKTTVQSLVSFGFEILLSETTKNCTKWAVRQRRGTRERRGRRTVAHRSKAKTRPGVNWPVQESRFVDLGDG